MFWNWLTSTLNTGIWVFISLVLWTIICYVYKWVVKKGHRLNNHGKNGEPHINRDIYTELISIKAITGADRVYINRFHNGSEFLPSHPVWKMSRSHEVVVPGITYEAEHYQNMLVSLVTDIITPVILGNSDEPGINMVDCGNCPSLTQCQKTNHHVVLLNVDEMSESYCKAFLKEQHIIQSLICGLEKGGSVIGFLGLDFCTGALPMDKIQKIKHDIIPNVTKIKFLMNQG